MVKEGRLGAKTGKGWYDWSAGRPQIDLNKATDKIDPLDFATTRIGVTTGLYYNLSQYLISWGGNPCPVDEGLIMQTN